MPLPIACIVLSQALRVSRYTTTRMKASFELTAPSIAIIGGGLAGLVAAERLANNKSVVTVYDMGTRGPGGRASTRKVEHDGTSLQFDHGCQFLRVTDANVRRLVGSWEHQGFLKPWDARLGTLDAATGSFTDRRESHAAAGTRSQGFCGIMGPGEIYVGIPGMGAICNELAQQPDIEGKWGVKVKRAVRQEDSGLWEVSAEVGRDKQPHTALHSALVIADQMNVRSESPGYVDLCSNRACGLSQQLRSIKGSPRFSLMVALQEGTITAPFHGASVSHSDTIEWVARDSSKPGRERNDGVECWVAVTTEAFSQALLSEKPLTKDGAYVPQTHAYLNNMAGRIWDAVRDTLKPFIGEEQEPLYLHAQRWGSSFKTNPLEGACLADRSLRLVACGDYFQQSSAEGAIMSGLAAANAVEAWPLASQQRPDSGLQNLARQLDMNA